MEQERLEVLHKLQIKLNPFGENPEAEKLRAFGLHNLCLRMVDPSLESLESISGSLVNEPFANLTKLRSDTYCFGENPRQFFLDYGIKGDNHKTVFTGIINTRRLIDDLIGKYDYKTEKPFQAEDLNPKTLSESAYEEIQINKKEAQIRKKVEQVKNEPDLNKRYRLGLALKRQLIDFMGSFLFTLRRANNKPVKPTWENLVAHPDWILELRTKDGGRISGYFESQSAVSVAQAAMLRYPLEKRLEQLPKRDGFKFDQLRFQFGSKAANLIMLSELVGKINRLRKGAHDLELAVPDFQTVPVDSYRAWQGGKLVDDDLHPYFEWVNRLESDYIVRSSAVFSEDGEKVTGAGVYESVRVDRGSAFENFKDAVTRIYESTDSPQALDYRLQNGINKEQMGLVIQRYVSHTDRFSLFDISHEGYTNSKLSGVPELMEIVTRTSRNFIRRKNLDFFLALDDLMNEDAFRTIHHFTPDRSKIDSEMPIRVAQLVLVIEKIWGRDIQIEFVDDDYVINVVQVRELPRRELLKTEQVEFPEEPPLYIGASIGAGDMELAVLDNQSNNREKSGAVCFESNYGFSFGIGGNARSLPKMGAVIVYDSDGTSGHIQTICAEKGLICIFPDVNNLREGSLAKIGYSEFIRLGRVRIVSNGIEGRIYRI